MNCTLRRLAGMNFPAATTSASTPSICCDLLAIEVARHVWRRVNPASPLAPKWRKGNCGRALSKLPLQAEHERHQVFLLLLIELELEDQVKEFHGVFQRQQ